MVRVSSGVDSKQDYQTPADFIAAVEKRFGKIYFDLAASFHNRQSDLYFTDDITDVFAYNYDALKQDWWALGAGRRGILWLNPPFQNIEPWAKKCSEYSPGDYDDQAAVLCFLVPAAVGSNWFRDYVWNFADIYFLNGRLSFDGKAPYGKDCLLACYHPNHTCETAIWDWRHDEVRF